MFEISRSHDVVFVRGPIPLGAWHRHHALQLCWALDGQLELYVDPHDSVLHCSSALLGGRAHHRLAALQGQVLFLEPGSHQARALAERYLGDQPYRVDLPIADKTASPDVVLLALAQTSCRARHIDPRIAAVLVWIDELERNGDWHLLGLAGALGLAQLSESRFLHLFTAAVGTPWRGYLMWRRALAALTHAAGGHSLTQAAHHCGYADQAHLSRQFKSMFGFSPGFVAHHSSFVQVD